MSATEVDSEYVNQVRQARLHLLRKDWTQARRVLESLRGKYPADAETAAMWATLREQEGRELRANDPFRGERSGTGLLRQDGLGATLAGTMLMVWMGVSLLGVVPRQVKERGWNGTIQVATKTGFRTTTVRGYATSNGVLFGIGFLMTVWGVCRTRGIF